MRPNYLKQTLIEWVFVALLAGLCAILTTLQYQWTGEIGRAEAEQLRAGINDQAQQLCRVFDSTLAESCDLLVPHGVTLNDSNRAEVHLAQFQKWQSLHLRPIFSHLVVAVPEPDGIQLYEQDLLTGKLDPVLWPDEWEDLRASLSEEDKGAPPYADPTGMLMHFPVFSPPPGGGNSSTARRWAPESEWVIFELDTKYLEKVWLPDLTRMYLDTGGRSVNAVEVKVLARPSRVMYQENTAGVASTELPVTMRFNRQGYDPQYLRGPVLDFRWELVVRQRPDALEAIVSGARQKNFAIALLLNAMIMIAGLALVRYTRQSRQLADAQMRFVANVSHELRTPLTVIRGAAHNLKRGVVSEPVQVEKYSNLILQYAEQLGAMVEQVLELAGAKKNQSAVLRQPVLISEVLHEAVSATSNDVQAAHCETQLKVPPILSPISGDPAALRRVFQNLVVNAAKHGGQGGWIGISAAVDEAVTPPMVEVQVADRGPGIPADEQAEIFKPFYRGAEAQSKQVHGSGLGLSLVREIIVAHGGTISVQSAPGMGARFTVRLPVSKEKEKEKISR